MGSIIPFDQVSNLPASIANLFKVEKLGVERNGFPSLSVKGKVFHIVRGDERTLVTRPDDEDSPAPYIEAVIIKQNPHRSKVFYASAYAEGSDEKPTCYSNDGLAPAADAVEPQAKKCAVCPHNQWGSRVSEQGSKGKACGDSQRLAVAPLTLLNDPMLLRVPPASLKLLDEYGSALAKRNVPYQLIVTRIGFDHSVAHPLLTFKPVGMVDAESAQQIAEIMNSEIINQIVGSAPVAGQLAAPQGETFEQTTQAAPVQAAPAQAAPAPAPQAEPEVKATKPAKKSGSFGAPPAETVAPVQAEPAAAPAPAKQPATVIEGSGNLADDIANLMGNLSFSDD